MSIQGKAACVPMKKIYIAGKITGDAFYREKFAAAERKLRGEGYIVLSPAVLPEGMTNADYMQICFAMIDVADKVAFLEDFIESQGARLEWDYCAYTKKEVVLL